MTLQNLGQRGLDLTGVSALRAEIDKLDAQLIDGLISISQIPLDARAIYKRPPIDISAYANHVRPPLCEVHVTFHGKKSELLSDQLNFLAEKIEQRLQIASRIGDRKKIAGLPIYVPEREAVVQQKAVKRIQGIATLSDACVERFMSSVIVQCRTIQQIQSSGPRASLPHPYIVEGLGERGSCGRDIYY